MSDNERKSKSRNVGPVSSIYPLHPQNTQTLLRISGSELTWFDRCAVAASSLFVVGAFAWVPILYIYVWKRWKSIPSTEKRREKDIFHRDCYFDFDNILWAASLSPHRTVDKGSEMEFVDRLVKIYCYGSYSRS